jgi:hypothetical protein
MAVAGCRTRGEPAKPKSADELPAEVDALAVANAIGTPVVAPAILEEADPDPEPDPVDAGPVETIRLLLSISPVGAEVFWGGKRIGISKPGEAFPILRPRNSGPLDLVIRAPGFLPYHTRLLTDREDKLSVGLRRAGGARAHP